MVRLASVLEIKLSLGTVRPSFACVFDLPDIEVTPRRKSRFHPLLRVDFLPFFFLLPYERVRQLSVTSITASRLLLRRIILGKKWQRFWFARETRIGGGRMEGGKKGEGAKSSGILSRVVAVVAVVAGYLGDFIRRKLSTEERWEAGALLTATKIISRKWSAGRERGARAFVNLPGAGNAGVTSWDSCTLQQLFAKFSSLPSTSPACCFSVSCNARKDIVHNTSLSLDKRNSFLHNFQHLQRLFPLSIVYFGLSVSYQFPPGSTHSRLSYTVAACSSVSVRCKFETSGLSAELRSILFYSILSEEILKGRKKKGRNNLNDVARPLTRDKCIHLLMEFNASQLETFFFFFFGSRRRKLINNWKI